MKAVILPDTVTELGHSAFYNCTDLESIVLSNGLTTIPNYALGGQSKLTEVVVPASVTDITQGAFVSCETLRIVKFQGNAPLNYLEYFLADERKGNYTVYYHKDATGFTSPK